MDRASLLNQLNKLTDSQRETLLFLLEVDEAHLRMGVSKNQQNIDIIKFFEQQQLGLQRLQKQLRDLAFFKEKVPQGTYPVGEELRQREEAREHEENNRVTPEKFYSFQQGTEWLGVFRQWDAPRSFRQKLLDTVINPSRNKSNFPAAAILGPGGCGKSVALRRLALDLVERGYQVWWVSRPERLVALGLDDLMDEDGQPQFLLIDEIQDLDSSYLERLRLHLKQDSFLVLVVAGRRLPAKIRLDKKAQFIPNEINDRVSLLDKIAAVLPAWATAASQLKAESLRGARLVRILVVLARRQEPVPQTLEELEEVFLQILADDLEQIGKQFPGVARAVLDAAIFREVGMFAVSDSALIALAHSHQPNAGIPILFAEFGDNPRWKPVAPLMSYDSIDKYFFFHHDELAEGLIRASEEGLVQPYIDDAYRKFIFHRLISFALAPPADLVIDEGFAKTISWFLKFFVCQRSDLVAGTTVVNYIHQLLKAGINHYAYLSLVVNDVLKLEREERLNLLLIGAGIAPNNIGLWGSVRNWVKTVYPKQQEEVLEQLYQAGCRSSPILNGWLEVLSLEKAKPLAKEWIQKTNQHSDVICRCLDLLRQEAKEQALQLLNIPGQDYRVICRCLDLLGQEAKEKALQLLHSPGQNPEVICRCLDLLGEEAKEKALQLLHSPGQDSRVICRCLDLLGQEAKEQALQLLHSPGQDSRVICRCLDLLGQEAKEQALQLLHSPGQNYRVICRCLDLVGQEAKEKALQLLHSPGQHPNVICRCLNLLGQEAKEQALQLLHSPGQSPEVISTCLNLLEEEAKVFAREKIASWTETHPELLPRCFTIAGNTPEAKKATEEILLRWKAGKKLNFRYKVIALQAPFDSELRTEIALQVLKKWRKQHRNFVTSALTAFWNNPDAVEYYCRQILRRWEQEIEYQRKNKRKFGKRHDGHIIQALAHPNLRKQAKAAAKRMLETEENTPGFLTPLLHQLALEITQGKFPSWSDREEDTEPLTTPQIALVRPAKPTKLKSAPKTSSSKSKRTQKPQSPKISSQSTNKSKSLEPWQEKLKKLKDI